MSSRATLGVGTILKASQISWLDATPVGGISNIQGPDKRRDIHDITSFKPEGGYREYNAGYRDGGDLKLIMKFTQDEYMRFTDNFSNSSVMYFIIQLSDAEATSIRFVGWVRDIGTTTKYDEAIMAPIGIKITGPVGVSEAAVWQDDDSAIWEDDDSAIWEDES